LIDSNTSRYSEIADRDCGGALLLTKHRPTNGIQTAIPQKLERFSAAQRKRLLDCQQGYYHFAIRLIHMGYFRLVQVIHFTDDFYTRRFVAWCDAHPSFAKFVNYNVDKIARKVRRAARNQEDEADVLAEVELAKLLLDDDQPHIEYEPFGTADANPDLLLTLRGESCCVEVKRIRPSEANTQQSAFLTDLVECLCAIPSNLTFSIDNFQIDVDSTDASLLSKNKAQILDNCGAALRNHNRLMESGGPSTFVVPNASGLEITFYRVGDNDPALPTSYFGGAEPVIFRNRQDEWQKYGDKLCESLRQLRPDSANVLAIRLTSRTHRPSGLLRAVRSIDRFVRDGDDGFFQRKKFASVDDFRCQITKLSAICVIPHTFEETTLWKNPTATHVLSDSLASLFKFTLQ